MHIILIEKQQQHVPNAENRSVKNVRISQIWISVWIVFIRQAAHEEKLIGKPTLLLGAVGLVFGYMMNFGYATFLLVLVCLLMPSGYIYLGEMRRSSFMKIKGIGELLYYLVKVILSPFVGIYALPKYLLALIKNKDKK